MSWAFTQRQPLNRKFINVSLVLTIFNNIYSSYDNPTYDYSQNVTQSIDTDDLALSPSTASVYTADTRFVLNVLFRVAQVFNQK